MGIQNSRIIIAKNILLDKSYTNVLDYTESNMLALIISKKVAEDNTYSFLRDEKGIIKTSFSYSDALKCNYMAFQNPYYSNKWFFAFIDDVEYSNDGTCKIHYTIDEFSTWFDYWNPKACFVEREIVLDDTVGLHTLPENLETGEYVVNAENSNKALKTIDILVASTVDLTTYTANSDRYGGVYQGYCLYSFTNNANGITALANTLTQMNIDQKLDSIVGIFLCPHWFFDVDSISEGAKVTPSASPKGFTWGASTPASGDTPIHKLTTLNGYTPRNNKLKTYPYMYLLMDNGNGGNATYKFEDFNDPINSSLCEFDIIGTPSFGGSFFVTPVNYKNAIDGFNERLAGGKYPVCGFQNDTFINWLTANSVPMVISGVTDAITFGASLAGIVGGLLTGGTLSTASAIGAYSAGSNIINTMSSYYQHSKEPPQQKGNSSSGDVNFATGITTFTAYSMSIKQEYARCIDDYFSRYGYLINRVKVPAQTGRTYWNFVKIGNMESIGYSTNTSNSVPASSMKIINEIYRRGVTIFHNHDNIGNFSLDNTIST